MKTSTIDHFCCCHREILFECGLNAQQDEREYIHPGIRVRLGFESSFELAVETLYHAIGLWVVAVVLERLVPKRIIKLVQSCDSNCLPRSVIVVGTPN